MAVLLLVQLVALPAVLGSVDQPVELAMSLGSLCSLVDVLSEQRSSQESRIRSLRTCNRPLHLWRSCAPL